MCTLLLLGPYRIERNQERVHVDTRKAVALLAVLALSEGTRSRDELAALLWPESDGEAARGALRRTLSTIRVSLGPDALNTNRNDLSLNAAVVDVDAVRFQKLLGAAKLHGHPLTHACPKCLPSLLDAITLYSGDFLAGFSLRDSPDFDDWQARASEGLRYDFVTALEGAAHAVFEIGQVNQSRDLARRLISHDPLNESGYRLLMRIFASAGDRSSAIRQYQECVRVLVMELGIEPSDETQRLYRSILETEQANPPRTDAEPKGSDVSERRLPLAGRDREVGAMDVVLNQIRHGPQVIVLEGEAGIGKTRLIEELIERARSVGITNVMTTCYAGEADLAYGPLIQLLRAALERRTREELAARISTHDLKEAARLVPDLIASTDGDRASIINADPLAARTRFLEGVTRALFMAEDSPRLVILDDLQWADNPTRQWVGYFLRRIESQPIGVVLAWRDEDTAVADDLRQLVSGVRRAGILTHLQLTRLERNDIASLLVNLPNEGQSPRDQLDEWLFEESEGIPLLLAEYLALASDGNPRVGLPQGVRELLRSRIAQVSERAKPALMTASLLGRSFDFETLLHSLREDEQVVIAVLEELQTKGILRELSPEGGGEAMFDFSHEKVRSVIVEDLSHPRARMLHRQIAYALQTLSSTPPPERAGHIAHHYQMAGMKSEGAEWFFRAGMHAENVFALREALTHLNAALQLGYSNPAAVWEHQGDLYRNLGEYRRAAEALQKARQAGASMPVIEGKLGEIYDRWGDATAAELHFRNAVEADGELSSTDLSITYSGWSTAVLHQNDAPRALPLAQEALQLAQAVGDSGALARASNTLGIVEANLGHMEDALRHLEGGLILAREASDPSATLGALQNLSLVHLRMGSRAAATALANEALGLSTAYGDRHREAAMHNRLADLEHDAGHTEAAMAHLKAAVAIYADIGVEAGELRPGVWKLEEW